MAKKQKLRPIDASGPMTRMPKGWVHIPPHAGEIDLDDICLVLSRIKRFNNGQPARVYGVSVAMHSMTVGEIVRAHYLRQCQSAAKRERLPVSQRIVNASTVLWAYLHDAHEAYTGDLTMPFKRALDVAARDWAPTHGLPGTAIETVQDECDAQIAQAIGLDLLNVNSETIKCADLAALAIEARHTFNEDGRDLGLPKPERWQWAAHGRAQQRAARTDLGDVDRSLLACIAEARGELSRLEETRAASPGAATTRFAS